jgi:phage terminase large subunit
MAKEKKIRVEVQKQYAPLLQNRSARYFLYYGGRAGGKSFGFADAILLLGRSSKLFVACVREVQDSIKDSVYKLLKDRADYWGFSDYIFYTDRVENVLTGTRIIFKGLQDNNAQNIKSLEGVDICWIEEGQSISKKSWDILNPTIRKKGSQIWVSMNRELENDPIWVALARNPDDRTVIKKVNYTDNLYCPEEIRYMAEKMKVEDYDGYLHVWGGEPVQQGDNKLIGYKEVHKALETTLQYSATVNVPLIVGVDVARFGDDKTAIARRRGRKAYKIKTYSKLDNVAVANVITALIKDEHPCRVNIDVGAMGAGVVDILLDRGFGNIVRAVNFGEKAQEMERYANRRAEMWGRLKNWLTAELPVSLTDCDGLAEDLTTPCKKYDGLGRLQIEEKAEIKKRLLRSTDVGDALALTFAEMVYPKTIMYEELGQSDFVDDNVYV